MKKKFVIKIINGKGMEGYLAKNEKGDLVVSDKVVGESLIFKNRFSARRFMLLNRISRRSAEIVSLENARGLLKLSKDSKACFVMVAKNGIAGFLHYDLTKQQYYDNKTTEGACIWADEVLAAKFIEEVKEPEDDDSGLQYLIVPVNQYNKQISN